MRKNVQYAISILNFIFEVFIILFCLETRVNPSVAHIDNDMLYYSIVAVFALLPFLFILVGNILMKKFRDQKTYKFKAFPIIFVVLILVSWVLCIYTNKSLDNFVEYKWNWILIGLGSVIMYVSNFFSLIGQDNYVSQKLEIHFSNEFVLTKIMKVIVCFFGFGGFIIILSGAFGFFFKHWIIDLLIIFSGLAFMIVIPVGYICYCVKKLKNKRKNLFPEKSKKQKENVV